MSKRRERIILGLDPGSQATGWGVIASAGTRHRAIAAGVLRPKSKEFNARLVELFDGITALCREYYPDEAAIESLFFQKNVQSALKLGHVRGVAVLCCLQGGLRVAEYAPAEVKRGLVGNGRAEKQQVAKMVGHLLGLSGEMPLDATDALGVAITHAHAGLHRPRAARGSSPGEPARVVAARGARPLQSRRGK